MARRLVPCFLALVLAVAAGCGRDVAPATEPWPPRAPGPTGVRVRPAPGVTGLVVAPVEAGGRAVAVSCSTCHSLKPPEPLQRGGAGLTDFHQGLTLRHGTLTCLACHDASDYDSLRLADGRRVAFEDVQVLCAQCHGKQVRDYEHGVHGGMEGYWDTTRGVQTRNQCTHCHAPHEPGYPAMRPTFKPRDRFLPAHPEPHDD